MNPEAIQAKLNALHTKAAELRDLGECLQGVRLEKSTAGGTASKSSQQQCKYARLRCGKGKTLAGGMKSRYVPLAEIANVEAAIVRGKALTKLEKQISALERGVSI